MNTLLTIQTFDYAAFIARIRELLAAPHFTVKPGVPFNATNPGFVEWKQKVGFAITKIEELGYKVHCDIRARSFKPTSMYRGTPEGRSQWESSYFQRALHETDIELRNIVEHFDQFGAPLLSGRQDVAAPPKPFDYSAFIEELRESRDVAENFTEAQQHHESNVFKVWKHDLVQLINKARKLGYTVSCNVEVRTFYNRFASGNPYPNPQFLQHLHETWIEIDHLVRDFEKYGDPKLLPSASDTLAPVPASAPPPKEPLKWSKEATLKWYLENTPAPHPVDFRRGHVSPCGGCICWWPKRREALA